MSIKKHIRGHEEHEGAISISLISALIAAGGVFAATDVPLMTKFFKIKKQNAVETAAWHLPRCCFLILNILKVRKIKSASENSNKQIERGERMDQETFAVRVEAIKARLYRTAYLYLGSESAALDAVDEAVYQALRALKKLRKPEFFETWITRILINECHRELRRRKRFSDEVLPETAGPCEYDTLPLKEAVRCLPEALRLVVVLRFFTGYTQAETAAALNIPQGTVATRQRRALELLRLELGEEEHT